MMRAAMSMRTKFYPKELRELRAGRPVGAGLMEAMAIGYPGETEREEENGGCVRGQVI
jgi:hypothetical protein